MTTYAYLLLHIHKLLWALFKCYVQYLQCFSLKGHKMYNVTQNKTFM